MPGDGQTASRFAFGRDPPGQRCRYILPGDPSKESYRLYTLTSVPETCNIDIYHIAASGFYATGYRDQAKCFSCGKCVQGWTVEDDPTRPEFHERGCAMAGGRDASNVESDSSSFRCMLNQYKRDTLQLQGTLVQQSVGADRLHPNQSFQRAGHAPFEATENISRSARVNVRRQTFRLADVIDPEHRSFIRSLDLSKEEDRRKTYAKWPTYPAPHLLSELAKEGFFYLGNLDRVQCFSCSLVLRNWAPNDNVNDQHRRHSGNCDMSRGIELANVPMDDEIRNHMDDEYRQHLDGILSNVATRDPPDPSPEEIRHLETYLPCSNPTNPHMVSLQSRIDTFLRWPRHKTRATPEQIATAGFFYLGESDKTKCYYCNGGLQNWDYNDNPWIEHAKWFPGCEFVLRMKGVDLVKELIQEHPNLNRPRIRHPISWEIIPPLLDSRSEQASHSNEHGVECTGGSREVEPMDVAGSSCSQSNTYQSQINQETAIKVQEAPGVSEAPSENSSLLSDVQQLERSLFCRVCGKEKTGAIVLPCAHLCCCQKCGDKVKFCPICNTKDIHFRPCFGEILQGVKTHTKDAFT